MSFCNLNVIYERDISFDVFQRALEYNEHITTSARKTT